MRDTNTLRCWVCPPPEGDVALPGTRWGREYELATPMSTADLDPVPRFGPAPETDRGHQRDVAFFVDRSHPVPYIDAVLRGQTRYGGEALCGCVTFRRETLMICADALRPGDDGGTGRPAAPGRD